jgi:hypothetical protein
VTAFENIKPGSRLRGLDPSGLAEVVQVTEFGPDALNVVFRVDGRVDQRLVMRGGGQVLSSSKLPDLRLRRRRWPASARLRGLPHPPRPSL